MQLNKTLLSAAILSATLTACSGDDGKDGADGATGSNGLSSLVLQTVLPEGNASCLTGGLRLDSGLDSNSDGVLSSDEVKQTSYVCNGAENNKGLNFTRIASFPVCEQIDANCDTDDETAAEIVAVSKDGMTLVYSDSPAKAVGFVDISSPASPTAKGMLALAGEPTSVAVKDNFALVGVNTSEDYINVSGKLDVVSIASQSIVASHDLGGQPDSVAISPDGNYAAVVIENERDEDLGDGAPPQMPAGFLVIVDTSNADPTAWTTSQVSLTDMDGALYKEDPEPEYVDINNANQAVITFQENNHIAIFDLASAKIVNHFSAGSVDLEQVDLTEGGFLDIVQNESEAAVLREPDGIAWINGSYFATADEGDLDGGSRGFTIFNTAGEIVWSAGNSLEHLTARLGHYPDKRSGNKGNEPENVEVGIYGGSRYLFVNSERANLVVVYDVANPANPVFKQVLPAGVGPEGGLAIPSRNLLVVASEKDDRGDKMRSVLNIYQYAEQSVAYPTLESVDRADGTPIAWGAMSALAADKHNEAVLYSVEDSFYGSSRIFTLNTAATPAKLTKETEIIDSNNVFATSAAALSTGSAASNTAFDDSDIALLINSDKTVNLDPEGLTQDNDGNFWIASEGAGTLSDADKRPLESLNFLVKVNPSGVIQEVVSLPADVNTKQIRFGFEGVSFYTDKLYVTFQRAWEGELSPRIGIYDISAKSWEFVYYPLDAGESQNGGWVGLSDIASLGDGRFLILERDNQGGPDAVIKRIYQVNLASVTAGAIVSKTLVRDLVTEGDLTAAGGLIAEKVEGLTVANSGDVFIINDNDGVDDNSGETQLINLGRIAP